MERYRDLDAVFEVESLPRSDDLYESYQLIRGTLAAADRGELGGRFIVLCGGRRGDLGERWFGVLRAVRSSDLRSRLSVLTWQELAAEVPRGLQRYLQQKYGILAAG